MGKRGSFSGSNGSVGGLDHFFHPHESWLGFSSEDEVVNQWFFLFSAPLLDYIHVYLVGGLEHFLFPHILGKIIPIYFHIFQRGSNHQPGMIRMIHGTIWKHKEPTDPWTTWTWWTGVWSVAPKDFDGRVSKAFWDGRSTGFTKVCWYIFQTVPFPKNDLMNRSSQMFGCQEPLHAVAGHVPLAPSKVVSNRGCVEDHG